jgi:hypothetical protein
MHPLPDDATPSEQRAGSLMLLVLAFFSLGLMLLLRHEMWQDEWQAWLIAMESPSLPDLFRNLRYEGHPGLWHLGLFLVSRITSSPLAMQLLHLLVATGAVYVFLKYSPFTRIEKILFIFGYFPLYEYAVISRNYAPGVLGLFSFCAFFCMPPRNFLLLAVILFLLCQTSVYGLMMALVLGVILLRGAAQDRASWTWKAIAALVILLLGIGLSLIQIVPPADSGFAVGWRFDAELPHLMETLAAVWKSYVPLPAPDYHFWGTNILSDCRWQSLLSVVLLVFGLLLFIRQPVPLFLYAVGTAGILTFTHVKYSGSLRHHGHLFLLLIAGLWLSSAYPRKKNFCWFIQGLSDFCWKNRPRVILVLLAAQLAAGLTAASLDLFFPFSASKDAARFIRQHQLDRMLILGHPDDAASAVAGCLGRPLYYPASQGWRTFVIWNRKREPELEPGELLRQAEKLSRQHQEEALLLVNYRLSPGEFPLILIQQFTNSLVPEENYYLYLVPHPRPGNTGKWEAEAPRRR